MTYNSPIDIKHTSPIITTMNIKRSLIFLTSAAMISTAGFEVLTAAKADELPITYPVTYPTPTSTPRPTPPITYPSPTTSPKPHKPAKPPKPHQNTEVFNVTGEIKMQVFNRFIKKTQNKTVSAENIKIVITNIDNNQTYETTPDKDGKFTISLQDGKYTFQPIRTNTFFAPPIRLVVVNHDKDNANFNGFAY